jgi:hypothetical protein
MSEHEMRPSEPLRGVDAPSRPSLAGSLAIFALILSGLLGLNFVPWSKISESFNEGQRRAEAYVPPAPADTRQAIIASSMDVNQVAKAIVGGYADKVTARMDQGRVSIVMDMDPIGFISLSRRNFWGRVTDLVPKMFERFTEARVIRVTGEASFRDLRGNDRRGPALWLEFSREDARQVNWRNVLDENLARIATAQWAHPSFSDSD